MRVCDTNLRWLVGKDPASADALQDGSRLEGIALSLRKPSNFCKQLPARKIKH